MGGREVPGTWSEALEILRNNYANSLVIQALADALHYKLVIITVHGVNYLNFLLYLIIPISSLRISIGGFKNMMTLRRQDENFVKTIEPKEGTAGNTLFFGHTGNHYIALRPKEKDELIVVSDGDESCSETSSCNDDTSSERFCATKNRRKIKGPSNFESWEEESYSPGIPVLPLGCFPYRFEKNDGCSSKKENTTTSVSTIDLTKDSPVKSEGKVKADIDSDSDELLSKSVFSLTELITRERTSKESSSEDDDSVNDNVPKRLNETSLPPHSEHKKRKRLKLDPSLWFGVDVEVVNELPYDIDGSKVFQVRFHKDGRNIHDGRPWKPWVTSSRKGFRGKRNVQSCRGSYLCTNKNCPYKNNLEEQTVSSSLDLEETNFADLATSKVNTFLAQLGRSVNIQKVLTLQPFTILGITLAQLFLSPSYTQTVTLNSFSKHIQWLSPLQFQLPS
ncbi:unnamed protein product [Porites lobata]|uniref:Uncharacterized protein n=1 Tax=Porites lobata TaxID=104759 RepID=A0ABN8N7D1_9CNID|nr:unnamed protein product [Porites lobata]